MSRKIIHFSPPFCNSVKTNTGKKFFDLVRLHFPKNNKFHKISKKIQLKILEIFKTYCRFIKKSHTELVFSLNVLLIE